MEYGPLILSRSIMNKIVDKIKNMQKRLLRPRILLLLLTIGLLFSFVRIKFYGHFDGLYILKQSRFTIAIADDVLLGTEDQVLWGIYFRTVGSNIHRRQSGATAPYLEFDWNVFDGSGFVRNVIPGGQRIIFCFSRFMDSSNKVVKGVFLGGGLPFSEKFIERKDNNDTGMATFDGKRWFHIWCNANEALVTGTMLNTIQYPSDWVFEGSRVVESSRERFIVSSRHLIKTEHSRLKMDRFAFFTAGEPYFVLAVRIKNIGKMPARYVWTYGDEPWLGNFGSSLGNVGWSAGSLHLYEGAIDTKNNSFIGMVDIGNPLAGKPANTFTRKANFIEWLGDSRPNMAYFSNQLGKFADEAKRIPLTSPQNRVLALQYGPEKLQPGDQRLYILAIGKAYMNFEGFPIKPQIEFDMQRLESLLAETR